MEKSNKVENANTPTTKSTPVFSTDSQLVDGFSTFVNNSLSSDKDLIYKREPLVNDSEEALKEEALKEEALKEEAIKEEALKAEALKYIVDFNLENALSVETCGRLWLERWNMSEVHKKE